MDADCRRDNRALRNDEASDEVSDQTETQTVNDAPLFDRSVLPLLLVVGLY